MWRQWRDGNGDSPLPSVVLSLTGSPVEFILQGKRFDSLYMYLSICSSTRPFFLVLHIKILVPLIQTLAIKIQILMSTKRLILGSLVTTIQISACHAKIFSSEPLSDQDLGLSDPNKRLWDLHPSLWDQTGQRKGFPSSLQFQIALLCFQPSTLSLNQRNHQNKTREALTMTTSRRWRLYG